MSLIQATQALAVIWWPGFDMPPSRSAKLEARRLAAPIVSDELTLFDDFTLSRQVAATPKSVIIAAKWAGSFTDDFYYRVYALPEKVNFGIVLTDTTKVFRIWNAYFEKVTCSGITDTNVNDVTITGLTAPFSIPPIGLISYTAVALREGDFEINGLRLFQFDLWGTAQVSFVGTRGIIFDFEPQGAIIETLMWKTDILTARDGISTEQRVRLRSVPRREFQWSVKFTNAARQAEFNAKLFNHLKGQIGLPIWTSSIVHQSAIEVGDLSITADLQYTEFKADSHAVIWQSYDYWEIIRIDEIVGGNTLILNTEIQKPFYGLKSLIPIRSAYLENPLKLQDYAKRVSQTNLVFRVIEQEGATGYTPTLEYLGRPVLLSPNVMQTSTTERAIDADIIQHDPDVGLFQNFSYSLFNIMSFNHGFNNTTREACWKFRQLVCSLYGRQKTIWLASNRDDIILAQVAGSADTLLTIKNTSNLAILMSVNELVTHIIFQFSDGQVECRQITQMLSVNDSVEMLGIDLALGREATADNCHISFLYLCRLTSDRTELRWYKPNHQTTTLDFTVVKA